MFSANTFRFDEAQVEESPGRWSTLTPSQFERIPLVDRIQLIVARRIRFFAAGIEVSAMDALKE
jgi:hypothetical protein